MALAQLMGIVNLTPDSFSDGGQYGTVESALARIQSLLAHGADWIDLGAESTRPGALKVSAAEEWQRLAPVLARLSPAVLRKTSVDTYKPEIMHAALEQGVAMINDVKGAQEVDDSDLRAFASFGASYVLMHMHRDPESMQKEPLLGGQGVAQVQEFLLEARERLLSKGFSSHQILLDPGIGFGKSDSVNLGLLSWVMAEGKNLPFLVGVSRKSMLGRLLQIELPHHRDDASKMLELALAMAGVKVIRTHEVTKLSHMIQLLPGLGHEAASLGV